MHGILTASTPAVQPKLSFNPRVLLAVSCAKPGVYISMPCASKVLMQFSLKAVPIWLTLTLKAEQPCLHDALKAIVAAVARAATLLGFSISKSCTSLLP